MLAGGTGLLGWLIVEHRRDGKPTTLGAASGAVAGLVGITPACGFVEPLAGAAIGLIAGVVCALAVTWKYRFGYDDSLDVVAVHGVGGVTGLLLTGLLASSAANPAGGDGLFYGGGFALLGHQVLAVLVTIAYSGGLTLALAWAVQKVIGLRAQRDDELMGLDEAEHAETAYDHGRLGAHLSGLHSALPHHDAPRRRAFL
jgi:Amt family ammonium transporter